MSYKAKIEEDSNGESFIKLPPELIKELGWNQYTMLSCILDGNNIMLKKKTDWTVEDLQEHFDEVMEDIEHNGTVHYVLHDGKTCVLKPYTEIDEQLFTDNVGDKLGERLVKTFNTFRCSQCKYYNNCDKKYNIGDVDPGICYKFTLDK